jgi:hypothetical protein
LVRSLYLLYLISSDPIPPSLMLNPSNHRDHEPGNGKVLTQYFKNLVGLAYNITSYRFANCYSQCFAQFIFLLDRCSDNLPGKKW